MANLKNAHSAYEQESNLATGFSARGVTPLLMPGSCVDSGPRKDCVYNPGKVCSVGSPHHDPTTPQALDVRFEPLCDRPSPPPLGVGEQEVCVHTPNVCLLHTTPQLSWLYTEGYSTDLIWDATMSTTNDESLELRDSVHKALRQTLANEEQQSLKQKLTQVCCSADTDATFHTTYRTLVHSCVWVCRPCVCRLWLKETRPSQHISCQHFSQQTCGHQRSSWCRW